MNYTELFAKAKAKADEALKAAHEGRLEDYETLIGEAEGFKTQAEAAKKAAELSASFGTPQLPAPLPTNGHTETPTPTIPALGGQDPPPSDPVADMNKSIYQIRYGTAEAAIKAVLIDIHGPNYEMKRIQQYTGFTDYLRHGAKGVQRGETIGEIILTPEYALEAIKTGQDIKSLKATMVEGLDNLGGYVVPVDFQLDIIRRIAGMTVMRGRARISQTSRDKVDIPKLTGGDDQYTTAVRVTWVSETPTAGTADTNLTFGLESIPVHDVMAETFLSRNVVEDSAVNLVSELTGAFSEASAIDEDNQFLTGDGVGKPTGILQNGTTPATGIATVNSGVATNLTREGMIDLEYEIASQYRANCVWIAARRSVRNLRNLVGSDGHPLWGGPDVAGEPATWDGFPIAEQEIMPAVGAGLYPVLFGDPAGYRIVDRIGMTVERYLDGSTARQNLVLYLMRRRLGGKLTHPERWGVQLISV